MVEIIDGDVPSIIQSVDESWWWLSMAMSLYIYTITNILN